MKILRIIGGITLLLIVVCGNMAAQAPEKEKLQTVPVIPVGLDAYRMWEKLPFHKIAIDLPDKLAQIIMNASDYSWPHTILMPQHANKLEYKHFTTVCYLHLTWGLPLARLQNWMDMAYVLIRYET